MKAGSGETSTEPASSGSSLSETATAAESVPDRMSRTSPGTAALLGAAAGVLTGLVVGRATRKRGNDITGDVAVHLLNKIELLTIRLQVRHARRGGPAEIDVHHVPAGAKSQP
jgi:hypothetical protein